MCSTACALIADLRRRQAADPKNHALARVKLAIDEWGIVRDWNPIPDGPGIGSFEHYYPLGDAIAVARALHELLRSADVVGMANWPQTVNVIGAIKTTRNHAAMDPVGHVLALYRAHVHGNVVPLRLASDGPLDAVAAWEAETRTLSLGLINYAVARDLAISLHVAGEGPNAAATVWRINGPSLGAINIPGRPEAVTTTGLPGAVPLDKPLRLPRHSITVVEVKCQE